MTNLTPTQPISELFSKAEDYYRKREQNSRSDKLMQHMMNKGTHTDKITALSKQLETNTPLRSLQLLVNLSDYNKNRKQAILTITTLTQFFQTSLQKTQKYQHFSQNIAKCKASKKKLITVDELVEFFVEHKTKSLYQTFLKNVQSLITSDLWFIKKTGITSMCQLVRFQELRSTLLSVLINKFGDKDVRTINFLTKQLRDFSMHQFKCIEDILHEIEATMFRKNVSQQSQFYCLNFLNNLNLKIMHETQLTILFKLYFKIFTRATLEQKQTQTSSKLFLNTIKGLNKLFPVIKGQFTQFTQVFQQKADFIYRTIHTTTNTKIKIQLLLFLYQTLGYLNQQLPDRYYNSLYSFLNQKQLLTTSLLELFFDLLLISIKQDENLSRIHAFVKRLLQLCSEAQPQFIITSLILVSKLQDKVQPLLTKKEGYLLEEGDTYEHYDMNKRDPQHAKASNSCLWELMAFKYHYHPTVRKFVQLILNEEPIQYNSNPLLDFSLTNFVQKVCLKSEKKSQGWKIKNHKLINKLRPSKYDTLINKPLDELGLDEQFLKKYLERKSIIRSNRKQTRDIEDYADEIVQKEINRLQGKQIDEDDDISYGSYDGQAEDDFDDQGQYDEVEGGDMGDDMQQQGDFDEMDDMQQQDIDQQDGIFDNQQEDNYNQSMQQEEQSQQQKGFNEMFDDIDKDDDYYLNKKKRNMKAKLNKQSFSNKQKSDKVPKTKRIQKSKPFRK